MSEDKKETLTEEDIQSILEKIGPLETPPEEMAARVRANVQQVWQEETVAQTQVSTSSRSWLRIAAAVAVISGTVYLGSLLQTNPQDAVMVAALDAGFDSKANRLLISQDGINWETTPASAFPEGTYLQAAQPVSLTLSNKMNTRLNEGTVISLTDADSIRLIEGSIYADSYQQTEAGEFSITTAYGTARDIGTQFMVTADDDNWSVLVREGEVAVFDGSFEDRVRPGEKLVIADNDQVSEESIEVHGESWQWTESARPAFEIDGRRVDDYLQWVARETGRKLRYASTPAQTSAQTSRLSGSISNLGATESLSRVLPATDLELIDSAENVIMVDLTSQ